MTNREIYILLKKIDKGYEPTPSEKRELTSVDSIRWRNIDTLPKCIGLLTALKNLDLFSINVSDISALRGLKSLTNLDLAKTKLSDIGALRRLTFLKNLDLAETNVSDISALRELKSLINLNLAGTNVSDISALSRLTSLKNLDLRSTNVSDISALSGLTSLINLDLRSSKVSDISALRGLKLLNNIDLRDLNLNAIPEWMLDLGLDFLPEYRLGKRGIQIEGVNLKEQPIEIFSQNRELTKAYYREKIKVPVNECKVIFLGDAESGKTHSIRRLLQKGDYLIEFKGDSTPGIEITVSSTKLDGSDIIVNYWDFGGQEIQHSMHRMFLTERTVYVIFLNARQDPLDERARYWLENIKSFAPEAPVLFINKIDQNRYPKINEKGIVNSYKNQIKKVVRMSALEDEPEVFLEKLQRSINNIILEMPTVKKKIPWSWKSLMEDIRTMQTPYLTTEEFIERCVTNRVQNYEDIHDEIVNLFQEIRVSFCYHKDRALYDYMLLSPKWLLNALYTIVTNSKEVAINGVITKKALYDILTEDTLNGVWIKRVLPELRYGTNEVNYILGVTHMFRLSYSLRDGSEFFPMLCDGDEKISLQEAVAEDALHFIFCYRFLPSNVMHRLIVEMQRDLDEKYVWLTGAVFRNEEQEQTAYVHTQGNDLHIYVSGVGAFYNPNEYLSPITNHVRNINKDMGLSAEEYVTYREDNTETVIQYKTLKGNISHGVFQVYDSNLNKMIDYRVVAKRYDDKRPTAKNKLLHDIIIALGNMQNDSTYYKNNSNSKELENARNRFVSAQLRSAKHKCSDQQTGGTSASGKLSGERDILIRDENDQDYMIYEGINLQYTDKKKLSDHLKRLINNYNPQGLPCGVLVTYLECERNKYKTIVDHYKKSISDCAPESYSCKGNPIIDNTLTNGQYLTCMKQNYECGDIYFVIYHMM